MDHAALTTLRDALPRLLHSPPAPLGPARAAATLLPSSQILRELRRLPSPTARVRALALLAAHPPLASLRRSALRDRALLPPPPHPPRLATAIADLAHQWRPLTASDSAALRALEALHPQPPTSPPPPPPPQPAPRDDVEEVRALRERLSALHEHLDMAVAVLQGADTSTHDGLTEEVRATWGRVRAARAQLGQVRQRLVGGGGERSLREVALVEEVDSIVRITHAKRGVLLEVGFEVGGVSEGSGDDGSEDEWEDVVELADAQEEKNQNAEREDRVEPDTVDWAAVMRGEVGGENNRRILESVEERGREALVASGADGSIDVEVGIGTRGGRGRGRGRARGHRRGGAMKGRGKATAKQRVSKVLGIKKRKSKKAFDDD